MGTHYQRPTSESVLLTDQNGPVVPPGPLQQHYSPDTGQWDGQLPHPGLAALVDSRNWPGLQERMTWTRAVIRAHQLPPPQAATLNEIAYRDDQISGCSATMEALALNTGYSEKSVRRAMQALQNKKLILAHGKPGRTKIMGLPVSNGQLPWPTPDR